MGVRRTNRPNRVFAMNERPNSRKSSPLKVVMRTESDYEWCATRLKALADPDRLQLVSCLLAGPKNVSELATELGAEMVKVSHHLGVLRHAGVVETERNGKFVIYRLAPEIASETRGELKTLDFGCCRLELPKPPRKD